MENKTFLDIAAQKGQPIGSVARAYARKFPDRRFRQTSVLQEDELSYFLGQKEIQKRTNPTPASKAKTDKPDTIFEIRPIIYDITPGEIKKDVSEKDGKNAKKETPQTVAFRWVMAGICFFHSVLVAYDLHILSPKGQGMLAGIMACLVMIGCLLVAHDPKMSDTSMGACGLITVLDGGAFFVHSESFLKSSPELGGAFINCLAGFICLMAIASVWLVRDSKIEKVVW